MTQIAICDEDAPEACKDWLCGDFDIWVEVESTMDLCDVDDDGNATIILKPANR